MADSSVDPTEVQFVLKMVNIPGVGEIAMKDATAATTSGPSSSSYKTYAWVTGIVFTGLLVMFAVMASIWYKWYENSMDKFIAAPGTAKAGGGKTRVTGLTGPPLKSVFVKVPYGGPAPSAAPVSVPSVATRNIAPRMPLISSATPVVASPARTAGGTSMVLQRVPAHTQHLAGSGGSMMISAPPAPTRAPPLMFQPIQV